MKKILCVLSIIAFAACNQSAEPESGATEEKPKAESADTDYPAQTGEVNDFEDILSPEEEKQLQKEVTRAEEQTGYDIVIVSLPRLPEDNPDILLYGSELGNRWGVGSAEKRNGLMLIVSKLQGKVGMVAGKGIEDVMDDERTERIINDIMIPQFSRANFYHGLSLALQSVAKTANTSSEGGEKNTNAD